MKDESVKVDIKMPSQIYGLFMPDVPSTWNKTIYRTFVGMWINATWNVGIIASQN